jgi:aromatic-L-amino-acid decarboxylase
MLAELYAASVSNPGFNVGYYPLHEHSLPSILHIHTCLVGSLQGSALAADLQWICSPACTELEQVTMDWSARMLGLDPEFLLESKKGGGVIMVDLLLKFYYVEDTDG